MPEITKKLQVQLEDLDGVYSEVKTSLLNLGARGVKEENLAPVKRIEGIVPSIWGWGGMKIGIGINKAGNGIELEIKGYIAQLATSPLTKNMDKFISLLAEKLKSRYGYNLEHEKMTRFIPKHKSKLTSKDKKVFSTVLAASLVAALLEYSFAERTRMMFWILILGFGYYLGRKFIYKDLED
jgi:hypothetical protein